MRLNFVKSITLAFALFLFVPGCSKKSNDPALFTHRVKSYKSYSNNVMEGQGTFEYNGNNITKVTNTSYDNNVTNTYVQVFAYPDANKIIATSSGTGSTETTEITLTNKKITEIVETSGSSSSKYKTTYTYNTDGSIAKGSQYNFTTVWVLSFEDTYSYSSGKLTLITSVSYSGSSNYEYKVVISYNGEEITESIHSSKAPGGIFTESSKDVYTYSAGKISKIISYYKSSSTWTLSETQDFAYDGDGNFITQTSTSTNSVYRQEYIYEAGSGNFRLLAGAFDGPDYFLTSPAPTKKSHTIGKTLRNSSRIF